MSPTRRAAVAAGLVALMAVPASAHADAAARISALEDRLRMLEDHLVESREVIASQDVLLRKQAPASANA